MQVSGLAKLRRNALGGLGQDDPGSRDVVTPDVSGPRMFVRGPRALCRCAAVAVAREVGGLAVFL